MLAGSVVGFVEPDSRDARDRFAVQSAVTMAPEIELAGKRLNLRFDGYRLARYPGSGIHNVLFNFKATHIIDAERDVSEVVSYNLSFQGADKSSIPIVGYPIFVGLEAGQRSLVLEGYSVNVTSQGDQAALKYLDSSLVEKGLELVGSFSPLMGQVSTISTSLLRAMAEHSKNQPVHTFKYAFDLDRSGLGLKLRTGTYIIAAVPEEFAADWDWSQWLFDPVTRRIVPTEPGEMGEDVDFNTLLLRIERSG
jgi:hypothetical protein